MTDLAIREKTNKVIEKLKEQWDIKAYGCSIPDAVEFTIRLMQEEQEKELDELGNKIAYLVEQNDTLPEKLDKIVDEWWNGFCSINKLKQKLADEVKKG